MKCKFSLRTFCLTEKESLRGIERGNVCVMIGIPWALRDNGG